LNVFYEIKQLKPLLHEFTWILVDRDGNFDGFEQRMPHTKARIKLNKDESFIMSVDVIGQNWYGTSVLESTLPLWKQWCKINDQVERFFNRCVGSRIALYYPVGRSVIGETANGEPITILSKMGIMLHLQRKRLRRWIRISALLYRKHRPESSIK
jgi:hypothetical protein